MNEHNGSVKIQRSLLSSPIWHSPYQVTLYLYCRLKANYPNCDGLGQGQFFTSAPAIAREINQSRNGVRIHLKNLEALGMIRTERSGQGLLITVNDWENDFGASADT